MKRHHLLVFLLLSTLFACSSTRPTMKERRVHVQVPEGPLSVKDGMEIFEDHEDQAFLERVADKGTEGISPVRLLDTALRVDTAVERIDWGPFAAKEDSVAVLTLVQKVRKKARALATAVESGPEESWPKKADALVSTCIDCHVTYRTYD